jgi:hypothetical protein
MLLPFALLLALSLYRLLLAIRKPRIYYILYLFIANISLYIALNRGMSL